MEISILKSDTFKTTNWSGGATTELYIHPEHANYQKRDFNFRLSKAMVTDQESVFTSLPEIQRKLMVLEGCITLSHDNQYTKQLAKFDVDTFDGSWNSSCVGSCTDFNLMMMGNTTGNLEGLQMQKNEVTERDIPTGIEFVFAYNYSGKINITIANESHCLNDGDLIVIELPKIETILLTALENSLLVWLSINT